MSDVEEEYLVPPYECEADAYDHFAEYEWMEQYCEFEAMMEQLKHDVYNMLHFGHEDGPEAYAAELYAEEQMMQEAYEQAWEDHLNPIQAFERQKVYEIDVLGMYPDSKDRYEYYGLQAEESADELGPEPRNEDECKY